MERQSAGCARMGMGEAAPTARLTPTDKKVGRIRVTLATPPLFPKCLEVAGVTGAGRGALEGGALGDGAGCGLAAGRLWGSVKYLPHYRGVYGGGAHCR